MPELALQGVLFASFAALLVLAFVRVQPMKRASNLRQLVQLRARLVKGDMVGPKEVAQLVSCCVPDALIWDLAVWLGVVVALYVAVWFLITTNGAAGDLTAALELDEECA